MPLIMVTITRGANWKISVYGREHGVPHFHVEGPDFRTSVGIATLEVIVGSVPKRVWAEARGWAAGNQPALLATWQELNG